MVENGAIQCGFCTPGLVVALTGFFLDSTVSDESAALDSIAGNLCRCTGYAGIKRAVSALCGQFDLSASPLECRLDDLIAWHLLPAYFVGMADRLNHYIGTECGFCLPLPSGEGWGEGFQKNAFHDHSQYSKTSEPPENAVLIAGGTDLFVQKPEKLHTQALHFLATDSLHPPIRRENTDCIINALTTIEQIRTSLLLQSCFPRLAEDFKLICSAPVRQRATVGGNLVNASTIADMSVFFLALDAHLTLQSGSQTRTVPLQKFFQAYKQIDLKPGEHLLELRFEIPAKADLFSYEKVRKRTHLDIASVNSALLIQEHAGNITKVHLAARKPCSYWNRPFLKRLRPCISTLPGFSKKRA